MIICIESWKGDCLLHGRNRSRRELQEQIHRVEALCDQENDNFLPLLCRMYGWTEVESDGIPDMTYDRDTGQLLP